MGGRFVNPVPQYLDDNGNPLAGGKLNFYVSGASTVRQNTYSDVGLTTPNENPVILDSAGRCPNIFAAYDKTFRVVLTDSNDVIKATRDNVQILDVQELVALAAELQAQIDGIQTIVTNSNPVRNATTEVITGDDAVTLTTSFLPHVCVGIDGRVSGTVSAGTMTSGSLSGLGSTNRQAKMTGVTGDASSIVEWRFRIGSAEALRFANETCSVSAILRQESGLTGTATIAVYKADAADNFSAVTLVGSTTASVASSTNTDLEYAGLAFGDVSNGIELVIKVQPGNSFTTKDFYLTDIQIAIGAAAPDFVAASYAEGRAEALEVGLGVFRDTGTANAAVITTRDAVSLYDGLLVNVYRPTGNSAAMTLNVDGTGAVDVVRSDGKATRSGDTTSGYYRFRYSGPLSKWVLENPEIGKRIATAVARIDTTTPTAPVVYGIGITSVTRTSAGIYVVNTSDTYATDTKILMMPQVTVFHDGTQPRSPRVFAITTTSFSVKFENDSSVLEDPDTGFFVHIDGILNS